MHRTVRAIVILTISYFAFGAYAFGVFLQDPLIDGQPLTVQAALEPFVYVVCMVIGNLAIYRAVVSRPLCNGSRWDENRLAAPAIALLLVIAFGAGLHTAGTLIEETFHSHSVSNAAADHLAYRLAYWLEELLSHYLIMLPYVLLLFLLVRSEQNRQPSSLTGYEKAVVVVCGLLLGGALAVGSFESAAVDLLVVPLNAFLLALFWIRRPREATPVWSSPFSVYWVVGTAVMMALSVAFRVEHGWWTQPTDLGFGVAPVQQSARVDPAAARCSDVFCIPPGR